MRISDHEKNQIKLIDEQVLMLQARQASAEAIIEALLDFVPEVRCLLEASEHDELATYLTPYPGFAYFVALLNDTTPLRSFA